MSIQKILRQHQISADLNCECGYDYDQHNPDEHTFEAIYTAHQSEMIEQHLQVREAAVIAGLADLLDEYESNYTIAECAALVEGEQGRQAVIDNWIGITEEPAAWLRKKAAEHHEKGFEHLRQVAYDAWNAGEDAGRENGRHSLQLENGWIEEYDPVENPYADC